MDYLRQLIGRIFGFPTDIEMYKTFYSQLPPEAKHGLAMARILELSLEHADEVRVMKRDGSMVKGKLLTMSRSHIQVGKDKVDRRDIATVDIGHELS